MNSETKILTDERIFALAAETDITSIDPKVDVLMFSRDEFLAVGRAIEQAALQSPEVQAWKKDARRYQYLRQAGVDYSTDLDVFDAEGNCLNEEELDGAVDAAMERQP